MCVMIVVHDAIQDKPIFKIEIVIHYPDRLGSSNI